MTAISNPSRTVRPGLTLAAVGLAGGLLPASLTGASVALPDIGADLHAGLVPVQWVVNAYNLTFASFMLVSGAWADKVGRRRMFSIGCAGFAVCALISATAPDIYVLDTARALAGIGAACVLTGGSAMLPTVFSGAAQARAFGIFGSCFGAGLALGPSTSGVLVGAFGWRSVFVLHLAICLIVLCAVPLLPESSNPEVAHTDRPGAVTFTTALIALTFGIVQGPQWGWTDPRTVALLALCVLLLIAFVSVETRQLRPMFDLSLLRTPRFIAVCAMPVLLAFGFVSLLVFLPSYFIGASGYSTDKSGLIMLILTIPVLLLPMVSGAIAHRIPTHLLLGGSLVLVGAGAAWLTIIGPATPIAHLLGPLVVIGIGVGVAFGLLDGAAISSVKPERAGMAAGMFNTARLASEAVVIAGMGSILVTLTQHRLAHTLPALAPKADTSAIANSVVQGGSVRGLARTTSADHADAVQHVLAAGYTDGLHRVLWLLAAVCWIGTPAVVALLRRQPTGRAEAPTGGHGADIAVAADNLGSTR